MSCLRLLERNQYWKETMRSSHVCGRTLAASLIASGLALALVPAASADPTDGAETEAPAAAADAPPLAVPDASDAAPALTACKQFGAAMNYAAMYYEDFAYATAGGGNAVNYGDPQVSSSNIVGRTALRQAAAAAFSASTTPGLQPEISAPMQSWSLNATRLILTMGIGGGGDALNSAATDLNTDAHNAQMACASAGVRA
jgi:hypothetical protein